MDLNSLVSTMRQAVSTGATSQPQLNISAKQTIDMPKVAAALSELSTTTELSAAISNASPNSAAGAAANAPSDAQLLMSSAQGGPAQLAPQGLPSGAQLLQPLVPQSGPPAAQSPQLLAQPQGSQPSALAQGAPLSALAQGAPPSALAQGAQLLAEGASPLSKLPVPVRTPDVYYASEAPASANLLSQGGVNAYIHLLNVLSGNQQDQKSADLTSTLTNASATLKSAYADALSKLSPQLQQKDWRFSVANGRVVFEEGDDPLSMQDLTDLQRAFGSSNAQTSARQLADALMSIQQLRKTGADSGSLAWGGIEVDDSNFSDVVDLREFVTGSAPGGNYTPRPTNTTDHSQMSPVLGGLDLRNMVTMRPNFLRPNGSIREDAVEGFEAPGELAEIATLHGRCACGDVSFIVEDRFEYAFYCHCSRCRIRTGSAFATVAGISTEKVQVTAGHENLLIEGECSDGYGARCKRCHAFLFAAVRERQYIHVSLGVLAEAPTRLPDHHIYVGSKAPWFQITDGLPQYDESP